MKVIKRNGEIVPYDGSKIVLAIEKAMANIGEINEVIATSIEEDIMATIDGSESMWAVEEIQDEIEKQLTMNPKTFNIGKQFILYRNEKKKYRDKNIPWKYKLLSKEFLSTYKKAKNPMNQLGTFVYSRTYSRWIEEEGRRENWWETVARAVDYNCSLVKTSKEEAETLYDNIFNLRQFLSGRTFWVGGTQVAKDYPMANFNCAFSAIDNFDKYKSIFYLLMVGSGVGLRILKEDVDRLPRVRTNIEVINEAYVGLPKEYRKDSTSLTFTKNNSVRIVVGDSKSGWVNALDFYLKILYSIDYKDVDTIVINYNNIRPKGERLKTFGGTASGHESLKNMFVKINKIITNRGVVNNKNFTHLKPIDCLDIANIIGENVVVGGVRRTAEIVLIEADDEECIQAKNGLYKEIEGQWIVDEDIIHRQMSNNSIYYKSKPSRERLHWQIEQMRYSGEPAWVNEVAGAKRRTNMNGVNPCFTGDMKLLTSEGYKTFKELNGTEPNIINYNGEIVKSKVWSNGIKDTVVVKNGIGELIKCTSDHRFMLTDGTECEAKNLKGKRIMPYYSIKNHKNTTMLKYGFIQGDGQTSRLDSDSHKGLEVNIGENDFDIFELFNLPYLADGRNVYFQNHNEKLSNLGFSSEHLPSRIFPTTYNTWHFSEKSAFLSGLYSANGSVIKKHRIAFKSTSLQLIEELKNTLEEDFNISSYITTNKSKTVSFSNGDYVCKESYDLNISRIKDIIKFCQEISFVHEYKNKDLVDLILLKSPKVISIKQNSTEEVYDFLEPNYHWGVVEGYVAHNCGEILLDSNGLCNLTTINVEAFVLPNGTLDKVGLLEAQKLSARAGYRMTCVELEIPEWNYIQDRDKLLGCSLTGWQDMVNSINLNYKGQKELLRELKDVAINSANEYADHIGQNRPLLTTTIKPEGTLSQLPTVSSGVHYSHSPYYIRRVRINAQDPLSYVCEELGYPMFPEVGQEWETCSTKVIEFPIKAPIGRTKYDVSALEQLNNYKMFMENYVQHNCSITVHVRENEWDSVEQWIWDNWDDVVAVSFLALEDSFYKLLPYESINKTEYEDRVKNMKTFIPNLLGKYEKKQQELDIGTEGCDSGVCPIR